MRKQQNAIGLDPVKFNKNLSKTVRKKIKIWPQLGLTMGEIPIFFMNTSLYNLQANIVSHIQLRAHAMFCKMLK